MTHSFCNSMMPFSVSRVRTTKTNYNGGSWTHIISCGERAELNFHNVNVVPGADQDLLSISALTKEYYVFHFSERKGESCYMETPDRVKLPLTKEAGLYWLTWNKAIIADSAGAGGEASCCAKSPQGLSVEEAFKDNRAVINEPLKADFWGNKYLVTFNCDVTHMTATYFCKTKAEVKDMLEDFIRYVKLLDYKIMVLTSDNGGEYSGGENNKDSPFNSVCVKNNIKQRFTAPYTPSQNGRSERVNKQDVMWCCCLPTP